MSQAEPGEAQAGDAEEPAPESDGPAVEEGTGSGDAAPARAVRLLDEGPYWEETEEVVEKAPARVLRTVMPPWETVARPAQLPPSGDWRQWLLIGGRGSGKTRAGAEWVRAMALGLPPIATRAHGRIALVAETLGDAREVMIDGESGVRTLIETARPVFEATRRRLVFANGGVAQVFSSEDPDALRGYQFDAAWGDELAKWKYAEECFDNLQLGLRLGERPRALFTTTPRPIPLLKRMMAESGTAVTHMRTAESRAGFMQNPVVYRSVRLIAENAAAIPLLLYEGAREVAEHPLLDLLRRPNAGEDQSGLLEALCGHLLLSGNAYLEAAILEGRPRALHLLRPDRVRTIEGRDGWAEAYEYRAGHSVRRIPVESDGRGPLLHLRLFHPLEDSGGFAPLAAAQTALDLHNAAGRWNKALLDNSARPSGALVYQQGDGGNLSPDQFDRLKTELETGYTGVARAGRPMLLEGGLDWKAMALSPKDMDFIEAKNQAARDIALAFGVPPMLLGIPGDNTYSNYAEANRAFFRLTVLPLTGRLAASIGGWLAAAFGEPGLRLAYDADRIEGLSAEREALWSRVGAADFLSDAEKREAVGYGPAVAG